MFNTRIENLRKILLKGEAILITDDTNRCYFSGMHSSAGHLLITQNSAYLLIDFRYFEKAKKTVTSAEVVLCEKLFPQLLEILCKENITTVLTESRNITAYALQTINKNLLEIEVVASDEVSDKIRTLRSIKSESEIKSIKKAQILTDKTFEYILNRIKSGVSEKEIMLDMEFFIRKSGSEGVSFDFIVVSGKNSSLPHGVPTDKLIENGDFVTMDFGAVVDGYHSDMTRTVAIGEITEKQRLVYDTVLEAQKLALAAIKPDVKCSKIDKIARDFIEKEGFSGCFGHGLGHSVGLEIHENPACNTRDNTLLQTGMIMTVEPGIYIENEFGVRIEDMVVITENGCENLTKSPKELIII